MVGDCRKYCIRREIALILCLLCIVFAIEAKTAWYFPPHTIGVEVQAAKALPADTPQVIPHGLAKQPLFFLLPFSILSALLDEHFRRPHLLFRLQSRDRSPSSISAFSPSNFLRPPPIR